LAAYRLTDSSGREVIQVGDELVRVLDVDPISVEHLFEGILDVVRDDESRR
jgi:uncharacterized protein YxjI